MDMRLSTDLVEATSVQAMLTEEYAERGDQDTRWPQAQMYRCCATLPRVVS